MQQGKADSWRAGQVQVPRHCLLVVVCVFGHCRRIWFTEFSFCVFGGSGGFDTRPGANITAFAATKHGGTIRTWERAAGESRHRRRWPCLPANANCWRFRTNAKPARTVTRQRGRNAINQTYGETIATVLVDKNGKRTVEVGKEKELEETHPDVFAALYKAGQ